MLKVAIGIIWQKAFAINPKNVVKEVISIDLADFLKVYVNFLH